METDAVARLAREEVITERAAEGWESRIAGGRYHGIVWPATDERQAITHHVLLVALLREDEYPWGRR
jgi:predicted transcriptional regulator of viral defense system